MGKRVWDVSSMRCSVMGCAMLGWAELGVVYKCDCVPGGLGPGCLHLQSKSFVFAFL